MKILVAAATRHGATGEIAESFDAVVLGSAVCLGHWLEPARKLAESCSGEPRRVPVRLFSSGPVGERQRPAEEPVAVEDLVRRLNARGHRLFGGRIDRRTLEFPERAVVTALRVADADNRDWPTIRAWGREIGTSLARLERSVS